VANPRNLPGWCVYLLEFFTHFPSRGAIRDDNYLIGANSAWRAEAIRGGAFPDQTLGEDLLATAEMRRLGFDVLYDPALTVRHRNREGWREFLRYCRKMGAAAAHSQTRIGRRSIGVLHRFPFLAFGIPLLMLPRIGLALVGSPPRYMAMFLALLPACAIGQLAWANAFRKGLPEAKSAVGG
jgi:cellulose synthase/poly-beta-1,6-N-acetylglucosamine synthase-like glycosyltransferase